MEDTSPVKGSPRASPISKPQIDLCTDPSIPPSDGRCLLLEAAAEVRSRIYEELFNELGNGLFINLFDNEGGLPILEDNWATSFSEPVSLELDIRQTCRMVKQEVEPIWASHYYFLITCWAPFTGARLYDKFSRSISENIQEVMLYSEPLHSCAPATIAELKKLRSLKILEIHDNGDVWEKRTMVLHLGGLPPTKWENMDRGLNCERFVQLWFDLVANDQREVEHVKQTAQDIDSDSPDSSEEAERALPEAIQRAQRWFPHLADKEQRSFAVRVAFYVDVRGWNTECLHHPQPSGLLTTHSQIYAPLFDLDTREVLENKNWAN
ncbi:uncharacterized protein HMPREF1541_10805 [Cyphellophora europaea CBS 101466]|uniref:Uncharacterized protein n=1 Tax=Cyphellophora europaea (strain CBS 101466) TaxID=1220924 RepID=W2S8J4_CYPE1|nr:uncharacterized protein HMPREF1541_10805 [Cyphellophora europaea CBS 101466]ETN44254.1 hypothetical protein HMPREF1541_10805 [Cyphellophora europaea CBS 101466]